MLMMWLYLQVESSLCCAARYLVWLPIEKPSERCCRVEFDRCWCLSRRPGLENSNITSECGEHVSFQKDYDMKGTQILFFRTLSIVIPANVSHLEITLRIKGDCGRGVVFVFIILETVPDCHCRARHNHQSRSLPTFVLVPFAQRLWLVLLWIMDKLR